MSHHGNECAIIDIIKSSKKINILNLINCVIEKYDTVANMKMLAAMMLLNVELRLNECEIERFVNHFSRLTWIKLYGMIDKYSVKLSFEIFQQLDNMTNLDQFVLPLEGSKIFCFDNIPRMYKCNMHVYSSLFAEDKPNKNLCSFFRMLAEKELATGSTMKFERIDTPVMDWYENRNIIPSMYMNTDEIKLRSDLEYIRKNRHSFTIE